VNLNAVIEDAVKKNYKIFSIGLSYEAGEADLRKMADATGGKFFATPSAAKLQEIFGSIYSTIVKSSSPTGVDLTLSLNQNNNFSIIQDSFNFSPSGIKRENNGDMALKWQNVSQYAGNKDGALDAGEAFSLSFNLKGLAKDGSQRQMNVPLILDEDNKVTYNSPSGGPKVIKISALTVDDPSSKGISKDIVLTP